MNRTASRRAVLRGLASLPLLLPLPALAQPEAPLSAQDQADIARIQAYLDGVKTLKAKFQQIAPNGERALGTAWLDRPGRMRFEYDPPAQYLLVAGHGILTFYDASLKQTSNIPLGSTPLGILLADRVTLSGDVTVTNIARAAGQIAPTLVRTASPGEGSLTLLFNADPLSLRGWSVLDAQRRLTRIDLYDIQRGATFDQSLFVFVDPNFYQPKTGSGG